MMIGHNNPPDPTPFEAARTAINDLMIEARNWLDGEGVTTQEHADAIGQLLAELRKAGKAADDARKIEAKPFDDGKAEVQARYKPLIDMAATATDACKRALTPFMVAQEAAKRAKADQERRDAEAKREAALEALRASEVTDLTAREAADALMREADKAERAASKAEKDKAGAKGGDRKIGLRTRHVVTLADPVVAARHMWETKRDAIEALLIDLAEAKVRAGAREIPGFTIAEIQEAV